MLDLRLQRYTRVARAVRALSVLAVSTAGSYPHPELFLVRPMHFCSSNVEEQDQDLDQDKDWFREETNQTEIVDSSSSRS